MDVRQLRQFLAVADTLNFTRAAQRLSMSTSPLSRSIQLLEAEVGGALFDRGARGVELTALGQEFVPYAERVVENFDALERGFTRRPRSDSALHVGFRSLPLALIQAVRDDVMRRAVPGRHVRLHPMESLAQIEVLKTGRLAFALSATRPDEEHFGSIPVARERVALALPDRAQFRELDVVRPEDVADLKLIVQPGVTLTAPYVRSYVHAAREVEHVRFEIVGGLAALIALDESMCICSVHPDIPWHHYLNVDGVVIRPLPDDVGWVTTYLVYRRDRDVPHDLAAIIDAARTFFPEPWIY